VYSKQIKSKRVLKSGPEPPKTRPQSFLHFLEFFSQCNLLSKNIQLTCSEASAFLLLQSVRSHLLCSS